MRFILVVLFLTWTLCASAEDAPQQQLNPNTPADAVAIVDLLTKQIPLQRDQAIALTVAIQTLRRVVQELPPAPALTPAPPNK